MHARRTSVMGASYARRPEGRCVRMKKIPPMRAFSGKKYPLRGYFGRTIRTGREKNTPYTLNFFWEISCF